MCCPLAICCLLWFEFSKLPCYALWGVSYHIMSLYAYHDNTLSANKKQQRAVGIIHCSHLFLAPHLSSSDSPLYHCASVTISRFIWKFSELQVNSFIPFSPLNRLQKSVLQENPTNSLSCLSWHSVYFAVQFWFLRRKGEGNLCLLLVVGEHLLCNISFLCRHFHGGGNESCRLSAHRARHKNISSGDWPYASNW